ncbi:MAG: hypothetical protein GEU74_16180 [Nitriliruptorales bacterium]|nr:hypothetical protein [Nitriliruptorales bacterium]
MTHDAVVAVLLVSLVGCGPHIATPTTGPGQAPTSGARKETTMLVTYGRGGGRVGPDDLQVTDDGTFTVWRSNHAGPVGRFAGTLESDALSALRSEVEAAAAAGPPDEGVRMPGGAVEEITIGEVSAVVSGQDPGGPWSALAARLKTLLDELTAYPSAAVALEVDDATATLHHRGTEPLGLQLSGLAVHVIRFGPGYARLDEWRSPPQETADEVQAGPGWTLDLPFDHGLPVAADQSLQVIVSLEAYDGPAAYPVQIVLPPRL